MTEQPVETEQQFLGNETLHVHSDYPSATALLDCTGGQLCPAREHLEGCYAPAFQTKAASLVQPREHYAPNAHRGRFSPLRDKAKKDIQDAMTERAAILKELAAAAAPIEAPEVTPNTDLQLEAEVHAGHAARSLENGELDAGIAWLQSALAFAQNARHSREFGILGAAAL